MDILAGIPQTDLITFFSILIFIFFSIQILKSKSHSKNLPPQPKGAWPIIGHLRLLAGNQQRHVTLGDLSDKYGPVYLMKIGVYKTLVISSWELAKECFTTNDKIFADRPKILVGELMGYNNAVLGFSSYGTYWRQMRKIATLELLSNHRLQMFSHSQILLSNYVTYPAKLLHRRPPKIQSVSPRSSILSSSCLAAVLQLSVSDSHPPVSLCH